MIIYITLLQARINNCLTPDRHDINWHSVMSCYSDSTGDLQNTEQLLNPIFFMVFGENTDTQKQDNST